ncbi:MFS transporter [Rothia nasisuis]|uniref:MFS transporter n=1 Tax=Rothia nasisuis TaxID=2109647 RepID=UPI001F0278E9|nr:MFS transporter [Rothia nasisuis]
MGKVLMDFTPLTYSPDFRRIWLGGLFSTIGFAITSVAIALEIYALTGSSGAVGLVGLVSVVPLIIGGLYGGVIADRYDRRKVALAATLGMWGVTLLIALHAWLSIQSVAVLYALIAAESLLQPINQSARGAIIPRLIKPRLLPAANTLMMSVGTLGMSAGPLLGGILVASVGYQLTYSINVFAMTVGIWALYRLPAMLPEQGRSARPSALKSIQEGLGFVRRNRVVGMTFVVDLLGMLFAQARPLIPALAALTFGGGEAGAGLLLAAAPVGALVGVSFSGFLKDVRRQGRFLTLSYAGWGLGFIAFGLVAWVYEGRAATASVSENVVPLGLAFAALAFMGWADALGSVYRSTIIQLATPDALRGRMQGLFIITVAGGPNLGMAFVGGAAELVGSPLAAVVGGGLVIVTIAVATVAVPALWSYTPEPLPDTRQQPTV